MLLIRYPKYPRDQAEYGAGKNVAKISTQFHRPYSAW